ncbi:MAG: hypothetical protein RI911_882 [Candidatus Parcubacteria bacterium]|jgi:undecaprenyl-diphosphatase
MHFFQALILGCIEGITEFLPISSTAHLVIASSMLGIDITSDTAKVFEIAVQLGAVAAIPIYYFKSFLNKQTLLTIIAAFIPTAVLGLILKEFSLLLLESLFVIGWALLLGGICLIVIELYVKARPPKKERVISLPIATVIGAAQSLALIPGVSRSGATIATGLLLGIPRATIAEFSFLLSVPTLGAATALALLQVEPELLMGSMITPLITGMVAAFFTAIFVIHLFMKLIRKYTFIPFGIYRVAIGIFILTFLA